MAVNDFQVATHLLSVLAALVERMIAAEAECRKNSAVVSAGSGCSIRKFGYKEADADDHEAITSVESWIEVETRNGRLLTCALELRVHPDRWIVDRRLVENFAAGEREVMQYEELSFVTVASFTDEIGRLTAGLISDFCLLDLSAAP